LAERLGVTVREPEVSVRTGDTPQRERARFRRNPAEILITMPESLYLLLTSDAAVSVQAIYGSGRTDLSTKPPCAQAETIA
jgi:ATP-dependent Lhr-like helicase